MESPQEIYEAFNVHFATVEENIGNKIKSNESTHYLLPNRLPNLFFFSPATPEEIYTLIGDIKREKQLEKMI